MSGKQEKRKRRDTGQTIEMRRLKASQAREVAAVQDRALDYRAERRRFNRTLLAVTALALTGAAILGLVGEALR